MSALPEGNESATEDDRRDGDRLRSILYLVETPGQFTELERLTKLLARRRVGQVYLVYDCDAASDTIVARIRKLGAVCANEVPSSASAALRKGTAMRFGAGRALKYIRELVQLPVLAERYRRLLRERRIDLVVITEDSVGGRSRALVAAASRAGIAVLLLPFTVPNPDEAAAAARNNPSQHVRRLDQRAFLRLRPRWARQYRGCELLRLPLGKALLLELVRLAPDDPWIDNRGPALIAAESTAMVKHHRKLGISPQQIVLTGTLVDRVLEDGLERRDALRVQLRQRLGLTEKPVLLCALPPSQFALGPPTECEHASYESLLADWLSALAAVSDHFAVVVRPHPRMAGADLDRLRQSGVAIALDDTASLIPLCDLYVAAMSATIRWAIACGRPVVNYDVYRYRYDDYDGPAGVIRVETAQGFADALRQLAMSSSRLSELTRAQADAAAEWGCLDGASEDRLLALCDRLLGGRRSDQ